MQKSEKMPDKILKAEMQNWERREKVKLHRGLSRSKRYWSTLLKQFCMTEFDKEFVMLKQAYAWHYSSYNYGCTLHNTQRFYLSSIY